MFRYAAYLYDNNSSKYFENTFITWNRGSGYIYSTIHSTCYCSGYISKYDGNIWWGIIILVLGDLINESKSKYKHNKKRKKTEKMCGQIVVMGFCVVVIWFFVGVFSIYPSVVLTGSMEPKIKPGDMILIDKICESKEIEELKEGDIITFHKDNIVITHRIIGKTTDEEENILFKTKGDNNSEENLRLVEPKEVIGKYVGVVPKVGIVVLWLKGSREEVPEGVEF